MRKIRSVCTKDCLKTAIELILILILTFAISGCSEFAGSDSSDISGGEKLTPEKMAELSAEIFADATTVEETYLTPETNEDGETVVFWADGGSVYHLTSDCSYIRKSENIRSGILSEAENAGKERICSQCAKRGGIADE